MLKSSFLVKLLNLLYSFSRILPKSKKHLYLRTPLNTYFRLILTKETTAGVVENKEFILEVT